MPGWFMSGLLQGRGASETCHCTALTLGRVFVQRINFVPGSLTVVDVTHWAKSPLPCWIFRFAGRIGPADPGPTS